MKNIKRIVVVTLLVLVAGGLAIAQAHRGAWHHADPASMVQHFSQFFPRIAAFDINKDGKLDATEREALARAITDGTLQLPAHTPPNGIKPTTEMMVEHIAELYAGVWNYDANHDGELDATEQAALKSAIEKGELAPLAHHLHGGGAQN